MGKAKTKVVEKKPPVKKPAPAKKPSTMVAKPARAPKGLKIAVFIDLDNTGITAVNLVEVLSELRRQGDVVYAKLYGYTDAKVAEFEEIVAENRLETIGRMRFKPEGVSVVDTRLVVDAIRLTTAHKFSLVFVWAGQGDLASLFQQLKDLGARTATVDVDELDTQSKFVDQRIKLFSGFTKGSVAVVAPKEEVKTEPEPEPVARPKPPKAVMPSVDLFKDHQPPQLPRREGAPEPSPQVEEETAIANNEPISIDDLPAIFDSLPLEKRKEAAKMDPDKRIELELFLQAQEILKALDDEEAGAKKGESSFEDEFGDLGLQTPEPEPEPEPEPAPKIEVELQPAPPPPPPPPAEKPKKAAAVSDDMFDDFGDLGSPPSSS